MTMSWRREKPSRFSERSATSLFGWERRAGGE